VYQKYSKLPMALQAFPLLRKATSHLPWSNKRYLQAKVTKVMFPLSKNKSFNASSKIRLLACRSRWNSCSRCRFR
jgi:hypothetical protein